MLAGVGEEMRAGGGEALLAREDEGILAGAGNKAMMRVGDRGTTERISEMGTPAKDETLAKDETGTTWKQEERVQDVKVPQHQKSGEGGYQRLLNV